MNKKELENKGYSFKKIGRVEYLDLSKQKEEFAKCPIVEVEQQIRNHFIKKSKQKGKALSIILPLVSQGQMTDLLSELYDLREESEQRKIGDEMAKEMVEGIVGAVRKDVDNILNDSKKEKCRPTKKQPKRKPQKKKVAKKK